MRETACGFGRWLAAGATLACLAGAVAPAAAFEGFDLAKFSRGGIVRLQEVNGGKLLLGVTSRGGQRTENNDLAFVNPNSITAIDVRVTPLDAKIPDPSAGSSSQAGIVGFFYWNGTGPGTATNSTGHGLAGLVIDADETDQVIAIRFFLIRCTNSGCGSFQALTQQTLNTEPVQFFRAYRLRLSYENATGTFTFQLDDNPAQTFVTPDAVRNAPTNQFKALRTRVNTESAPTATGRILALFDDVSVNGQPYESFDARTLPRVQVLPPPGTFASTQVVDVVVLAETRAGDPIVSGRLLRDGADVSALAAAAIIQPLASGGISVRFPNVPMGAIVAPGTSTTVAAELTTQSGEKVRGHTIWRVVQTTE